jgi:hypothetical protein
MKAIVCIATSIKGRLRNHTKTAVVIRIGLCNFVIVLPQPLFDLLLLK